MRVNVNAFIAVILCTVLLGGLWLLKYRTISEDNVWNPGELYSTVGSSLYSTSHVSSGRSGSSVSSGASVSLPSSRTLSRRASSVPYHLMASSPNNLISSSPHSSITSSPISYASSNATFHSFGGGGSADGAIGGSLRANPEAMPSATSLSIPSMPNYAMVARSAYVAPQQQADLAAVSAISEAASAYSMPMRSSITSIGGQLYQIGSSGLTYSTSGSRHSINGRLNAAPIIGNNPWERWLNGLTGDVLIEEKDGVRYYSEKLLYELYLSQLDNFPNLTWDEFLAYINGDQTGHVLVPLGEPWILLLFAALLVVIQRRRLAKQ